MAYITAAETVLLFAKAGRAADNTRDTLIKFDMEPAGEIERKRSEAAIWWRLNTGPWHKVEFRKLGINDDPVTKGSFHSEALYPGDVLQYRMYNNSVQRGYQPDTVANETQPHSGVMVWHVEIFGLLNMSRNAPDKLKMVYRPEKYIGGTYYGLRFDSPGINTNILFEIAQQEPIYGLPNTLRFAAPERSMLALGAQHYELQLMPLQPGTDYYSVIRYSDDVGNWIIESEKFTTLRRQVTLKADAIYIDNDGDPFADGEASFSFQFSQGPGNAATFFMGSDDFKVHTEQTVAIGAVTTLDTSRPPADQIWPLPKGSAEKVFGPFSVTPGMPDITVYAAGTEYDGFSEPNEHAASVIGGYSAYLSYPYGPAETVIDKTASLTAVPVDGDFQFTLNYRYSVVYV